MTEYEPYHGNDVWIETTDEQKDAAIRVGLKMREFSRANGHRTNEWARMDEPWARRRQALGELCQMIACVGLVVPIVHRPQSYNGPDIGDDIQVRLIGREHYGLRVKEDDEPHWRVLGIVVPPGRERDPRHRCPGWFYVREARQHPEWEMTPWGPPPMHCVPQKFLRHMDELRQIAWEWF